MNMNMVALPKIGLAFVGIKLFLFGLLLFYQNKEIKLLAFRLRDVLICCFNITKCHQRILFLE
jgi:hypothetical protein